MKINTEPLTKISRKIPVKYLTLFLSISGVLFLYALSLTQQPIILTNISSLEDYEGKEVTLTGTIIDYTTTSYGSQLITIQKNTTQLTVFSDLPLVCRQGDQLQATGTIQEYKNGWELILSNPKTATIISTWENKTTTIKSIADHPQDYLNIPINTTGIIDIKYDELIYIKDNTGNYTIPLLPPNFPIPDPGTTIYLHATLTYDSTHLRYILTDCTILKENNLFFEQ